MVDKQSSAEVGNAARFYKCALQVNPHGYKVFRGKAETMTVADYNRALLDACLTAGVKVIGIANHGSVDGIDAIRELMTKHEVVVFPGFEIASTEKVHFVCLFPEDTTRLILERYLGKLDVLDPDDGAWPSNLGGNELIDRVVELGGFIFAAHATSDSGLLTKNLPHVWMNKGLEAAQIPASLDEMKTEELNRYRLILENKTPEYFRERLIAVINAKDVAEPAALTDPRSSCLIKMTRPCFSSFKTAFKDPESRVRLVSDLPEVHHSWINSVSITGGYLDGADVHFSEHLNSVIGGRGTGKSTLLECLRYALDRSPIGPEAGKQHEAIIRANVGGKHRAHIEVQVSSAHMGGSFFTISRRYGESPSVKDSEGKTTNLKPSDLIPTCEIYGQNEIHEIAKNPQQQAEVLARFLRDGTLDEIEVNIAKFRAKLADNRKRILDARNAMSNVEEEVEKLPALEERLKQYKALGLEQKLALVQLLAKERQLGNRVANEVVSELDGAFQAAADVVPNAIFLGDTIIDGLPHKGTLRQIRETLQRLANDASTLLKSWKEAYAKYMQEQGKHLAKLTEDIKGEEAGLDKAYSKIPAAHGKTGRQISQDYQQLVKDIERIQPMQTQLEQRQVAVKALEQERASLLADLSKQRSKASSLVNIGIKRLNRRLEKKIRLEVRPESQRDAVITFLLGCQLDGVAGKRLEWIRSVEEFTPVRLVDLIRQGEAALRGAHWNITSSVAQALLKLEESQLLELQEVDMMDEPVIELNVSHSGEPSFKVLGDLSSGQQCTAILHLLLLDNNDPLILDQPEDNLDNAFIADRIVTTLRKAKLERQFLFATHNANIPVFGDAEWIGVLEADADGARIPPEMQGAIDIPIIRDQAAEILEGGKEAFTQRREKYCYP